MYGVDDVTIVAHLRLAEGSSRKWNDISLCEAQQNSRVGRVRFDFFSWRNRLSVIQYPEVNLLGIGYWGGPLAGRASTVAICKQLFRRRWASVDAMHGALINSQHPDCAVNAVCWRVNRTTRRPITKLPVGRRLSTAGRILPIFVAQLSADERVELKAFFYTGMLSSS